MGPLDFIGPASDLVRDLLDKAFPSPEDKARVAQVQADVQIALLKQATDADGAFRSFVVDYEGAGDKVSPSLQWYRGSVRPTITYGLIALFGYGFCNPTAFTLERMQMLWQLNMISLGFWFGERALAGLGVDVGKIVGHVAGAAAARKDPVPPSR